MWPRELSRQLRQDPLRRAEVKVFDALAEALSGGWHIFYSRPWLGLTQTGGERDGECDFVVVHPDRGVLTLEVKGGGISFDPSNDRWTSRDGKGNEWEIKNPVAQAMQAKHVILNKAKLQRGWPQVFIRFRHGVVFPDAPPPAGDLGADRPRDLFCCRPDMTRLRGWIEKRLSGGESERGPGSSGLAALQNILARPFMLRTPLAYRLEDDDAAITALTPEQFRVLDLIADIPRAAAGGGAGTGKTILACEDARRLAEAGRKTLLTCRGLPLAADIRQRMKGSGVTVLAFDELGATFASDSSEDDPAERLMGAVESDENIRFGAIIVDEAQDFRNHWWVALDALLVANPESRLHAYFDTNQQVYGSASTQQLQSLSMVPIRLTRNLRNTQAIHSVASHHYQGPVITADGPAGVSIASHPVADQDIFAKVANQIRLLTGTESVKPADIAVLVPDDAALNVLRKLALPAVLCSTIIDFKGLERPVIIVAATRAIADQDELAYVALSRARTHMILIGEAVILDWLAPSALQRGNDVQV
ncbi:NERD domain-containing protein [Bradyrhizobium sp. AUGA SZCCT0169]|uniref:nuclease-related domain-containing DEAD/DEAH box helicase n=1 Tax=Bradyrhizobium sp. AUGA SZCCT0169 TaxID=2807663 RepID=UPI001BA5F6EC|nr:NERD domain-containing protein [Bradyrhizobium sp. AUGA SZCCT0169]MBR1247499.1 NERD domain-containing protein [Bradyrhizobium sp. AUGA SZCCT0169]